MYKCVLSNCSGVCNFIDLEYSSYVKNYSNILQLYIHYASIVFVIKTRIHVFEPFKYKYTAQSAKKIFVDIVRYE